ncbi:hypothetical protein KC19_2G212300 [Ceratodon purpureus]|uniref:TF-B3 domain-containing protein n=1 Tax=Ceratodon purpureus TaxID=3225 RepID=A0A8T0IXY1_CERPU|nr:hypothetical protein KC19_2G212300 [Ceratodon purpureus]
MAETDDATVGSPIYVRWPLSLDEKPEVLRKLRSRIHFEKTITASSAAGYVGHHSRLALPFAFVKQHGDKFQKNVLLQTVLSSKAWPVRVEICFKSPGSSTKVKFSGGWRAFANFNGLQEGDSLIFRLAPMSKFKVYVFSSTRCSTEIPLQVKRKRISDSQIPQKKTGKQSHDGKDEQSSFDETTEDAAKSRELRMEKKTTTNSIAPLSTDVKTEVLRKLQGRIYFEKTVIASNASGSPSRDPTLVIPFQFLHSHGDKLRRSVILRVTSSSREWPVKLTTPPQLKFRGGWRAFAEFNGLLEGDSLIFLLTAVSEFEVYVFSSTGSPKKLPDSQSTTGSGSIHSRIHGSKCLAH